MRATLNRPPPVAETSRPSARASKRSRRKGTADPIPPLQGCKRLRSRHSCAQGYAVLRMQSAEKWGGAGAGGSGPQTRSPKPRSHVSTSQASPSRGTQPPPKPRPPGTGSIEGPIGGAQRLEPCGQASAKSWEPTYRAGWMTNGTDEDKIIHPSPATNGRAMLDTGGHDLSLQSRPKSQVPSHHAIPGLPGAHHEILCGHSLVTPPSPNLSHTTPPPAGPTTCPPLLTPLPAAYISESHSH